MTTLSSLTSSSNSKSSTAGISSGIGGLVSGFDTDSLVEKLSAAAQKKIDSQNQKSQKLEWRQDAYRTVISAMKEFQDSYLDILSDKYLGSSSTFNTTVAKSSSDAVTVKTTSSSYEGSFTIDTITQLAAAEAIESKSRVSSSLTGTVDATKIDTSSLTNKSISITVDGKVKTITFDSAFITNANTNGIDAAMQDAIDDAFGYETGAINVSLTDNKLAITAPGSTVKINAVDKDTATLGVLGFSDGQSNKMSTSTSLGDLKLVSGQGTQDTYKFSINNVDFEFSKDVSLSKMISKINASDAGVTISYSSIKDTFTLTADNTGAGNNIEVKDTTGTLMGALGLTSTTGNVTPGKNAILTVDGKQIVRSSNKVTIDGVNVELEKATAATGEEITVTMKADSSDLKEMITKFVDDYNTMIDLINTYTSDEPDSDYQPLTDAQKEDMTDEQIEKWEKKAKAGILFGDSTLKSIASKLQLSVYSSAGSGGISLLNLGITSAGHDKNGKLEIDDDKLEKALSSKASEIMELFTAEDTGLSARLTNIFDDAIKTSGARGSRGSLVEIAGVEDTTSATQNSIYDQLDDNDDLIEKLEKNLTAEQKRLWNKFSAMETAISKLNSQSSMLSSFASS